MSTIVFPGFAYPLGRNTLWREANVFLKLSIVAGRTSKENIFGTFPKNEVIYLME